MKTKCLTALAALAAFSIVRADTPQYQVIYLHPIGYSQSFGHAASGGQQVGYGNSHAILWTGTPASVIDLHPAGHTESSAIATDGNHQFGTTIDYPGGNLMMRAAMWQGSAATYVSLNPIGANQSAANGFSNGIIAGSILDGSLQAGYWTSFDATSWIPLPNVGFSGSQGIAIHGNLIVGDVEGAPGQNATVWDIANHTTTNIHPAGYTSSQAFGTDGVQHVGIAGNVPLGGGQIAYHAIVWDAATNIWTDLHPAAFDESWARDVRNGIQVGFTHLGVIKHAALWQGTAASYYDLHQLLPATATSSEAQGIDEEGNIIGSVYDGGWKAVMWKAIVQGPTPYDFLGFFSPLNDPADPESVYKIGRSIPIKFALENEGQRVGNAKCTISLDKLDGANAIPIDIALFGKASNDGAGFRYDGEGGNYIFNLDTKNLEPGHYRVTATVAETGQTHSDTFTLTDQPGKKK